MLPVSYPRTKIRVAPDMPKVDLTAQAVERYKAAPGERIDYFDTLLGHGFALRVSGPTPRNPQGGKSWVLFYRFGGKLKRLTIEPGYPALGLAGAREKAREALRLLKDKGEDPAVAVSIGWQTPQAFNDDGNDTFLADVTHDAAHGSTSPSWLTQPARNGILR